MVGILERNRGINEMMTLGSLFDGIGGWQLSAIRNGIKPIWSAEIEPFPIAVTKEHFPDTIQLGDVTKIDGSKIPPVDIICMGSPCQDLSVAGLRQGIKEGTRSGLFFDAIRIIRQMRMSTGGVHPKFCILENVPGMLSSNGGMDFRTVLASYTESEIPMPVSGRWASAGMVRGRRCDVAWRCIDAESYLPQRRNRIFVVCDFRKSNRCAAEILFVETCLRGNPQAKRETWQTASTGTERCVDRKNSGGVTFDMAHAQDVVRMYEGVAPTLNARMGTGGNQVPLVISDMSTVGGENNTAYSIPHDERSACYEPNKSDTLTHYVHYVAYSIGHDERSAQYKPNVADPLTANDWKQAPVVCCRIRSGKDGGAKVHYCPSTKV